MVALKTSLNGEKLCIAGTEDLAVLNSIISAVGNLGAHTKPKRDPEEPADLFLSVGGLTSRKEGENEHLRWIEQKKLTIGDQILIEVLETPETDAPSSLSLAKETLEGAERQQFEYAKKIYLQLREKYETGSH